MSTLVWVGTALGLGVGALHAAGVFRGRLAAGNSKLLEGVYYGAWTVTLWALFGAYVLVFWLLGLAGMVIFKLLGRRGVAK